MVLDHSTHAGAQHFCQLVLHKPLELPKRIGLVVGCGEGHEATYLSRALKTRVVGIDLCLAPPDAQAAEFDPVIADALRLPFPDELFGFVFYHHVIEHVADPEASLAEIGRVLRLGGVLYVGTPNRRRLIGYLGSHTATLRQKIAWNLADYTARLRGRFRNELGTHAGFSKQELEPMLRAHFSSIQWLTRDYLNFKYAKRLPRSVVEFLASDPVLNYSAPSIYALCRR